MRNPTTQTVVLLVLLVVFLKPLLSQDNTVDEIEMVFIKGGTFTMGNDKGELAERPEHEVQLNSFYLSKYEVTNAQFCEFLNEVGNKVEGGTPWLGFNDKHSRIEKVGDIFKPKEGYSDHPVMEVTWYGARAFCEWKGGRLPTEAEWEYAAKGGSNGDSYKFSGSNNANEVAWFGNNSGGDSHPVGLKKPNKLGLYDMTGNTWEWCYDWFSVMYYKRSPDENPSGPEEGKYKIIRGGGWTSLGFSNLYNTVRVIANPDDTGIVSIRLCKDE